MTIITKRFTATGTTCESCARVIERTASKVAGVRSAHFDYASGRGTLVYDDTVTDIDAIFSQIETKGYRCSTDERARSSRLVAWVLGIIGLVVLGYFALMLSENVALPLISPTMGYALLFVLGLLTGFHCIAMCGGFVISYTANDAKQGRKSHRSHLLYAGGKLLSYTLIGAAFGLIGSIIAFTPTIRGIAGLIAGIFLILFGLKMLGVIPSLRRLGIRTPASVSRFVTKNSSRGPLVIGLLNGLMIACGPLQAIYIMAAGTGSVIEGAKLLFIFGLGTLPVMLGFGYLTSVVSSRWTSGIIKVSGTLVIVLGLFMMNNGLTLTGSGLDLKSLTANTESVPAAATPQAGYQEIHMDVTASGWNPDRFVLEKGVPVKWIINGKEITSCNKAIQVPKYGLSFDVKPGEQVIEFTPTETGVVSWSCWMGMIPGTFVVTDSVNDTQAAEKTLANLSLQKAGTCGMKGNTGGGCGCGMM
jgi:uncharacterized protein